MLRLRVVQAEFGDCLILEFGSDSNPRYILIDGGPQGNYQKNLRYELVNISQAGGCLDLAVLSHVDNDHVLGLLELMAELVNDRAAHTPDVIPIQALWHNAFQQTTGENNNIPEQVDSAFSANPQAFDLMPAAGEVVFGIQEGNKVEIADQELGIPMNTGFDGGIITVDVAPRPVKIGDLELWVVGPSKANLERLKQDWLAWLQKFESQAHFADPVEADKIDRSVPNLSSIMLLAAADGRKILLTGDGRGDDLLDGLKQAGLLGPDGRLHVDVLKLPHHGSARNVNRAFFDSITADQYIISANGKYNNPDLATLIWLVEAVRNQQRQVQIVVTNQTDATQQLAQNYPPEQYGYQFVFLEDGQHSLLV